MGFGIYSSVAGANAREIELEVLANNIANMQTTGFKEMEVSFASEVDDSLRNGDMEKAQALVRQGKSHVNFAQGSVYATGNPLDLAVQGDGFFAVQTPSGIRYTRDGNFTVSAEGTLTTQNGFAVLSGSGPVAIPADKTVSFGPTGEISAGGEDIGRISVYRIAEKDRDALRPEGGNLYALEGAEALPAENFRIAQGHLENSNVNLIRGLTRIIEVSRAYEAHQKSMAKQLESTQQLNQIAKVN
jgi:flagellar basal-body rod protein FlgF